MPGRGRCTNEGDYNWHNDVILLSKVRMKLHYSIFACHANEFTQCPLEYILEGGGLPLYLQLTGNVIINIAHFYINIRHRVKGILSCVL